ncbi:PAS domain-containing protein [bacterium]|nr:PAS domain-containing protein [bacterium]
MAQSRYTFFVSLRVILISITAVLFSVSLQGERLLIVQAITMLLLIVQTWLLIGYTRATAQSLNQFLLSLKHLDHVNNPIPGDKDFNELNLTYNQIVDVIKEAQLTTQSERRYFQSVLDHMNVGVFTLGEDDKIEFFNRSAKRLLGISSLRHLNDLRKVDPEILTKLESTRHAESYPVTIMNEETQYKLSMRTSTIRILGSKKRIVSFQDINSEMVQSELNAWERMIRVLSHEIMNSISPIKSLSNTIKKLLTNSSLGVTPTERDKAIQGLDVIHKQSSRLAEYISSHKQMLKVPKPLIKDVSINGLFKETASLLTSKLKDELIQITWYAEPQDLHLNVDPAMINQVLINLINNAADAITESSEPKIRISATENGDSVNIEVLDNWGGIDSEVLDSVFVPYFTTKPDGMGIGLSLSRQIVQLHGGTLQVRDTSKTMGTIVRITLPKG